MEIWEKNIKALASKNKKLADEIKEIILQGGETHVQVEEAENKQKVLTLEKDGYLWYLNSRLDPKGASGLYVDRYKIKPFYRYFVFGFGDGETIRRLLEKCDKTNAVIICEPDKEILAAAIMHYDLEDVFLDDRFWMSIFEMWEDMYKVVFGVLDYSYIKLLEFCILPGYDILYTKECQRFMDEVNDRIGNEMVNTSTYISFNRKIPQNMLFHMKNMIEQRNAEQIKSELQKIGVEDIPAILIAAGPSLDKNIKEIKNAVGKAFIFVVDAALKTVIQEGIEPDLVCTVDAKVPERFFETVEEKDFLWSCSGWTNQTPIQKYGRKIFYYNTIVSWWDTAVQKETSIGYPRIESGGSVSTEAFELLCYFGFQTIIFVGQDLAFTGGQSHTKGIKGVLGNNDDYIKQRCIVQVEDAEGNLLDTDFQMSHYREWFEKKIEFRKEKLKVIDATEGGAKIKGTVIMTLKDAIAKECRREVNIAEVLKNIPPFFTEAQQKRLYKKMEELETLKKDFYEEIEKEIRFCRKLSEKLSDLSEAEILDKLTEIAEQNKLLDEHPFKEWVALYTKKEEFDLMDNILSKEDMKIEEIMERTIRLLKSYQAGIPLFEEDFHETFKK